MLTLFTTPVVYVLLDKLRRTSPDERQLARHPLDEQVSTTSP
jgi:multidrug efflux pump